jgi:hypothetical protein
MKVTEVVANYLQARFFKKLNRIPQTEPGGFKVPRSISLHLLYECERISDMLVKAMENQCKQYCEQINLMNIILDIDIVDWDAEAYSHGIPGSRSTRMEIALLNRYPPKLYKVKGSRKPFDEIKKEDFGKMFSVDRSAPVTFLTEPCIIMDIFGRILTWYLPEVLSDRCSKGIWSSCSLLQGLFEKHYKKVTTRKDGKPKKLSWRNRGYLPPS